MLCPFLILTMGYRGRGYGRGGGRGQGGNNNYYNNNNNGGGGSNNGLDSQFMSRFNNQCAQWNSFMEIDTMLRQREQESLAEKSVEAHYKKKFRKSSSSDSSSSESHDKKKKKKKAAKEKEAELQAVKAQAESLKMQLELTQAIAKGSMAASSSQASPSPPPSATAAVHVEQPRPDPTVTGAADFRFLSDKALAELMNLDHALAKGQSVFSAEPGQPFTWKDASADLNKLTTHDLQLICAHARIPAPATKPEKIKRIIEHVHRIGLGARPLQLPVAA